MAMNVSMICRTANIAVPYVNETVNGKNGQFQRRRIMYSVAVDRKYRTTSTVNGQQVTDNPTDFFLVEFVGGAADAMNKHASVKKADGKLQSRFLYLEGTFETYRSNKPIKATMMGVNMGGQLYNIPGMATPDGAGLTQTKFVVDYMRFLDPNPQAGEAVGGYTQEGAVQYGGQQMYQQGGAMPVQAAPAQYYAPAQGAMPVQQEAPMAPAQTAMPMQAPAAPVGPVNGGIPAPMQTGAAPVQAPAAPVQAPVAPAQTAPAGTFASTAQQMMAGVAQQMAAGQAQAAAPTAPTVPAGYQPTSGSAPF